MYYTLFTEALSHTSLLMQYLLNPLPDDKILALSKLKAFADNSNVVQMIQIY